MGVLRFEFGMNPRGGVDAGERFLRVLPHAHRALPPGPEPVLRVVGLRVVGRAGGVDVAYSTADADAAPAGAEAVLMGFLRPRDPDEFIELCDPRGRPVTMDWYKSPDRGSWEPG